MTGCTRDSGVPAQPDRPSRHGALLGQALAEISDDGRALASEPLPDTCFTCAVRAGCMTNQMASTGLVALNCVLGIDEDPFACHHGMKDGEPTKLCAGYMAAKLASYEFVRTTLIHLNERLDAMAGPDEIRFTLRSLGIDGTGG